MYRRLEEEQQNVIENEIQHQQYQPRSIITFGRVCNMIGEINKKKNDYEAAIKFYLRGISQEPSYIDNYIDLADICELLNEFQLNKIFFIFAKIISQLNEGGIIPEFNEASNDGDGVITREEWEVLAEAIEELKQRIAQKKIGSHLLRAVNVLQRLIEKYLFESEKLAKQSLADEGEQDINLIAHKVLLKFFNMMKVL